MVSIRGIFFCRIVKFKCVIHGYTFMHPQLQIAPHLLAGILLYTRKHSISNHVIPKERSDCGNAAIKPRAESSSLELCRGGAGSTEGQSIVVCVEIATACTKPRNDENKVCSLRVYFYIPANTAYLITSFRRSEATVGTLRLSRGQNQARLNYAEAEQGRPKVNLSLYEYRLPRRAMPSSQ